MIHKWKSVTAWACLIAGTIAGTGAESKVGLKEVVTGLTSPTVVTSYGKDTLLVTDQIGLGFLVEADGKLPEKPFLDLRTRLQKLNQGFDERGLLGLALHPAFSSNRKFYVFYSGKKREGIPEDWDHTAHVSEFTAPVDRQETVDLSSERVLLEIDKPYFNHNSGRLAFGPDGFLYIGVGDGGNANDVGRGHSPEGNGQDKTKLLGKILRIDVDHRTAGRQYAIPRDNPFQDGKSRPEIYAYGLRNPWGISFDRGGEHQLFAADVGQSRFEEVNIIVKGGNYGWNIREGFGCFDPEKPKDPPLDCPKVGKDGSPLIDPIIAYKNLGGFPKDPEAQGISVTGGYVYRGKALPGLTGRYIFADWSRDFGLPAGTVFMATRPKEAGKPWTLERLDMVNHPKGRLTGFIVALGEDSDGEIYIMTNSSNQLVGHNGKVFKLVPQ